MMIDSGVDVIMYGKKLNDMSNIDRIQFIMEHEIENKELTRENESKYFNPEIIKVFKPRRIKLIDYVREIDEKNNNMYDEEYCYELGEKEILINGENNFSGIWRRYPICNLFLIDGKWKYIINN